MANFYTDIPELKYHLNNPMMQRICELKERGYEDKDKFDYAPQDYADAIDSYDKVLEITGEITGEIIAPNAEGVDEEGPHCANGRVEYEMFRRDVRNPASTNLQNSTHTRIVTEVRPAVSLITASSCAKAESPMLLSVAGRDTVFALAQ